MHPAAYRLTMLAIRLAEFATVLALAGLVVYVVRGNVGR